MENKEEALSGVPTVQLCPRVVKKKVTSPFFFGYLKEISPMRLHCFFLFVFFFHCFLFSSLPFVTPLFLFPLSTSLSFLPPFFPFPSSHSTLSHTYASLPLSLSITTLLLFTHSPHLSLSRTTTTFRITCLPLIFFFFAVFFCPTCCISLVLFTCHSYILCIHIPISSQT